MVSDKEIEAAARAYWECEGSLETLDTLPASYVCNFKSKIEFALEAAEKVRNVKEHRT